MYNYGLFGYGQGVCVCVQTHVICWTVWSLAGQTKTQTEDADKWDIEGKRRRVLENAVRQSEAVIYWGCVSNTFD